MRVIFLDFDGVLNGHEWCHLGDQTCRIGQRQAGVLNEILRRTDASVCVSSTWSRKVQEDKMSLDGFAWMLRTHGIVAKVIGAINGRAKDALERHRNIKQFVAENDIKEWIVIDDADIPCKNRIRPNPACGLTPVDVSNATHLFGVE